MALISCENICLAYDDKEVISDLSFQVNRGDMLCIVGENGSGKTTLIKGLLGLISPVKGKIGMGDGLRQKEIGYMPQQTMAQKDFPASVFEIVLSGCLASRGLKPFYGKKEKTAALENIKKLGIENLKNRCYHELSGGQQQRVLLARALCATKTILLLDEPVAALDPVATDELYHVIEDLNKKEKITVIMVSHDIKCSIGHSTHVLHLQDEGTFFGTVAEYKKSSQAKRFLGGCCDHD